MDCNVFRKRLTDLIEDNLSYDMKEAMLQHICECEVCRAIYEEELSIDEIIRKGLSVNPQSFRSLRSDIMKNIDKNKYGKSPLKKLLYHMKKYRATYTTMAALIVIAVFVTPYIMKNGLGSSMKKDSSFQNAASSTDNSFAKESKSQDLNISSSGANGNLESYAAKETKEAPTAGESNKALMREASYMPRFEKKQLDKSFKVTFNTPWQNSLNKEYSATVEGKGNQAQEEGIGNIILKDLSTKGQYSFSLLDNEQKQFSPKAVQWIDNEKLLVIVGHGQGTVDRGGDLYILNINTSQVVKADPLNSLNISDKRQITKILSVKLLSTNEVETKVEILVYDDDNYNISHNEEGTIIASFN